MKLSYLLLIAAALIMSPALARAADAPKADVAAKPAAAAAPAKPGAAPAKAAPAPAADEPQAPAHEDSELTHQEWTFNGMFGTYDRASLQRGLKVYREVCSACHAMKHVYFRNLEALGYKEGQVKNIASQYQITDGPNDEGEMFQRPGQPSDHFPSPFANDNASRANNNGALPPDLSLIVKGREGGADYVYGVLTGFEKPPAGATMQPNQYWNHAKPGHVIAMPPPLADGQVQYEDGSPQTLKQYAHDVATFLTWASDPYMEDRKRMGIKVLLFLAVFAGIMYAVKRRIWANVHH